MDIPKKIFVSYKYSDIVEGREGFFNFRDDIINKLGSRSFRHKGEDEESYDLSDYTEDQIRAKIFPDIKNSSITIVLISPNTNKSRWIPWEVSLSLRERVYDNLQNKTRNGIIGVYIPLDYNLKPEIHGSYEYYFKNNPCGTRTHFTQKFPKIIEDNTFNLRGGGYPCSLGCCKAVYNNSEGSYIELVTYHDFINSMEYYLESAWKRRNNFEKYETRINLKDGV